MTFVFRSPMMAGMAMLTMVTSSSAMNMPTDTATRIHHLRGWPWSISAVLGEGSAVVLNPSSSCRRLTGGGLEAASSSCVEFYAC